MRKSGLMYRWNLFLILVGVFLPAEQFLEPASSNINILEKGDNLHIPVYVVFWDKDL